MNKILHQSLVLTRANLSARYRGSFFGYLWVLMGPLATYMAQAYIFHIIFKIQIENFFIFLLFGICPWIFFAQTIEMVAALFTHKANVLKSYSVSPLALVLAQAIDNFLNSITVIIIALCLISFLSEVPWLKVIAFPIPFFVLMLTTSFIGFLIAVTNVFFYDTKFVTTFLIGIMFYLSPVLYPENYVPAQYLILLKLNPMTYLLRPFRDLLISGMEGVFFQDLGVATMICLIAGVLAMLVWKSIKNDFYFKL